MAGSPPDPLCCHYALAKDLAKRKMDPGVRARDKLLMDAIEDKQREIFEERDGLAETDKERKVLRTVLRLVRNEVENLERNRNLHRLVKLEILTKNNGIIGGSFQIEEHGWFCFLVDKKNKKKKITLEEFDNKSLETPILCQLMKTRWRSSGPTGTCRNTGVILAAETLLEASEAPSGGVGTSYCFTFPLRCTACLGGAKVTRYFKWNDCVKDQVLLATSISIFRLFAQPWKLDNSRICWSPLDFPSTSSQLDS